MPQKKIYAITLFTKTSHFDRFLTGFFNAGQTLPWGVLMAEYLEAGQRRFLTTITGFAFSAGLCILSATAWLTQDWRLMSAILGFSGFTFLPLLYLLVQHCKYTGIDRGIQKPTYYVTRFLDMIDVLDNFLCRQLNFFIPDSHWSQFFH